jgi:GTP cyclohydrolase FolE2
MPLTTFRQCKWQKGKKAKRQKGKKAKRQKGKKAQRTMKIASNRAKSSTEMLQVNVVLVTLCPSVLPPSVHPLLNNLPTK